MSNGAEPVIVLIVMSVGILFFLDKYNKPTKVVNIDYYYYISYF